MQSELKMQLIFNYIQFEIPTQAFYSVITCEKVSGKSYTTHVPTHLVLKVHVTVSWCKMWRDQIVILSWLQ